MASWFVDEKFKNGSCAAFLILPKAFCIFLSHQGFYHAEAWGGLVMFEQWTQSDWGSRCGQPFTLGQCCTAQEPEWPKCWWFPRLTGLLLTPGSSGRETLCGLWALLSLVSVGLITSPACPGIWSHTQVRWLVFDPQQCRGWEIMIWRAHVVHTRSLCNVFPLNPTWLLYLTSRSSQQKALNIHFYRQVFHGRHQDSGLHV